MPHKPGHDPETPIVYERAKPGLRRRMQEFAEVSDLGRMHPERVRRQMALNRQRNVAEGKPALAPRRKIG